MNDTFSIKRGDNKPILRATLYSDDEYTTPTDLTNAIEVRVKVGRVGRQPFIDKLAIIEEPASDGEISCRFTEFETRFPGGNYLLEFEVTWEGGDITTYPKLGHLNFNLIGDLDG